MSHLEPLPYATPLPPYSRDLDHLRLLSIFHYVAGGLAAFGGLIGLVYLLMGIFLVNQNIPANQMGTTPVSARAMGLIFIAIGCIFPLVAWTIATCLILSGRFLGRHTHYVFSMVIAGICCLQVPLGTLLGIFTIIVLCRDSVKQIYGR